MLAFVYGIDDGGKPLTPAPTQLTQQQARRQQLQTRQLLHQCRQILKNDVGFVKHLITSTHTHLSQLSITNWVVDKREHVSESRITFSHLVKLGRTLFHECILARCDEMSANQEAGAKENKKDKNRAVFTSITECFLMIFKIVVANDFGLTDADTVGDEDLGDHHDHQIMHFVNSIMDGSAGAQKVHYKKAVEALQDIVEAVCIMDCIAILYKHLDTSDRSEVDENNNDESALSATAMLADWLSTLVKEHHVEDSGLAKGIIGLFLNLRTNDEVHFGVLASLANQLQLAFGQIQPEDEEADDDTNLLPLINEKTQASIVTTVLNHLTDALDETEWCINQLRIRKPTPTSAKGQKNQRKGDAGRVDIDVGMVPDSQQIQNMDVFENDVCDRLAGIIEVLAVLETMALPETLSEHLFKVLRRTYKILAPLTKWISTTKKAAGSKVLGKAFVLAIEASAIMTRNLYSLMPYIQTRESTEAGDKKGKKKGGKSGIGKVKKISRESKLIPDLIYVVEQFERYIIELSKKTDRSTTRDFRVMLKNLESESSSEEQKDLKKKKNKRNAAQEEEEEENEEGEGDVEGEDDENEDEDENEENREPAEGQRQGSKANTRKRRKS
ncbi:hypothetical protein HK102_012253 [Quaeritorhiza haematococci]|nr:hypothetical protein HK102_012253 [Quaeritorhiza haematococci]